MSGNDLFSEDAAKIVSDSSIPWNRLDGKEILITGATGLIGSMLVKTLLYHNSQKSTLPIKITVQARNLEKLIFLYSPELEQKKMEYILCDIEDIDTDKSFDYIVHAAGETSSKAFLDNPIHTIHTIIEGTENILRIASKRKTCRFIFLSTMEVYGIPDNDMKISEDYAGNLDSMKPRSCYPISKKMAENMCVCYAKEFGFEVSILRLAQTFGPGVSAEDRRIFAEFARCVIENRNIVLHTKGETKRSYLYTADAVSAILTVMLNGESSQIYNLANEDTYCSIYDMALLVADDIAQGNIKIEIILEDEEKFGYAPELCMNLDTRKIQKLGWKAKYDLKTMYIRLIKWIDSDF